MPTLRNLTRRDIDGLSDLLPRLRPYGAPRWQPDGVRAALQKVADLDAADVLMAALRLSQDRGAETPGQIAITTSGCWRERVAEPTAHRERYDPAATCAGCGRTDCRTRRDDDDDHRFVPVGAARAHKRPAEAARLITDDLRSRIRPLGDRPEESTHE